MKGTWKRVCLMGLVVLCVAGCGAINTQKVENPEQTPAYPQASLPVPSFTEEEKQKAGLPDDISEESLKTITYMMANPDVDIVLSVPIYWQRMQPEGAPKNQIYFFLRADQAFITSFSISSGEKKQEADLQYVESKWEKYRAIQEEHGTKVENESDPKEIEIGDYKGVDIRFEAVHKNEMRTINHLIIWTTEKKEYWCTLSSKTEYWEYAENSLMEILKRFTPISKAK